MSSSEVVVSTLGVWPVQDLTWMPGFLPLPLCCGGAWIPTSFPSTAHLLQALLSTLASETLGLCWWYCCWISQSLSLIYNFVTKYWLNGNLYTGFGLCVFHLFVCFYPLQYFPCFQQLSPELQTQYDWSFCCSTLLCKIPTGVNVLLFPLVVFQCF